jgi:5,10-methylenetetrahydromethanopterin reductase
MDISCAFATSMDTPDHIAEAERLGYVRAWCYDSPALYPDVWMVLALAAARTRRIGLGPAVLVPSLRHPMVNAAAIATLAQQAPGRVAVAIGSGFTGRMVLGQRPMAWADVADYVRALRALLRGEDVEWDDATLRMLHPPGFGESRPVDVPILIGADGPKGLAVAGELGDGVFSAGIPQADAATVAPWRALLAFGTVLDEGEDPTSERALAAAGPALAVAFHAIYERGGRDAIDGFPGGPSWRDAIEAEPATTRHLAIHEGHLVAANPRDDLALAEAAPLIGALTLTAEADELRARLGSLQDAGVTEIAYQPAGPDIARELAAFAAMAAGPEPAVS